MNLCWIVLLLLVYYCMPYFGVLFFQNLLDYNRPVKKIGILSLGFRVYCAMDWSIKTKNLDFRFQYPMKTKIKSKSNDPCDWTGHKPLNYQRITIENRGFDLAHGWALSLGDFSAEILGEIHELRLWVVPGVVPVVNNFSPVQVTSSYVRHHAQNIDDFKAKKWAEKMFGLQNWLYSATKIHPEDFPIETSMASSGIFPGRMIFPGTMTDWSEKKNTWRDGFF
jgi:hypothetical protein